METARSIETRRSSSGLRLEGRMGLPGSLVVRVAKICRTLGPVVPNFNSRSQHQKILTGHISLFQNDPPLDHRRNRARLLDGFDHQGHQ